MGLTTKFWAINNAIQTKPKSINTDHSIRKLNIFIKISIKNLNTKFDNLREGNSYREFNLRKFGQIKSNIKLKEPKYKSLTWIGTIEFSNSIK